MKYIVLVLTIAKFKLLTIFAQHPKMLTFAGKLTYLMKKALFIIFFQFISYFTYAQGEANIWYFGENAGLDFNSGVPVPLTNGQLNTEEGTAVISNASGQLQFYTDGRTVYNKNHQIMPNGTGLMGYSSTSQSAIIVPKPGSSSIFYIFTIAAQGFIDGARYSVVDLNLNGGLGDVTNEKNILIYTPTSEKISVVKHVNNVDFWIVTHGLDNNSFYAYLLNATGLSSGPVVSNTGIVVPAPDPFNSIGCMKISPDGSKIAIANYGLDTLQLLDFNNATGVVSNPITLLNTDNFSPYGVEFSPNNEMLYASTINIVSTFPNTVLNGKLFQFNLNVANIPASVFELASFPDNYFLNALQLGPDGKIYIAENNSDKLSTINNPNLLGTNCNFQYDSTDLGGKLSFIGLPGFVQSFFDAAFTAVNTCLGEATQFNLPPNITSATWNFGDGSPTVNALNPTHIFNLPGVYTVSVIVSDGTETTTRTKNITISLTPTASQPQNILPCDTDNNGSYNFDLTTQNTAILNGQDPNLYTVKYFANATDYSNKIAIATPSNYTNAAAYQQQTIIAEVSNNANGECNATTTFTIDVFDTPLPNAPANITNLTSCDNTTVGTDTDGRVVFNLTQRAIAILNGQSASQFSISYYTDAALSNLIATPANYQNTNPTETIYVKVVNNDNTNCVATTSFNLQVFQLPAIATVVNLKQCDDNIDGFSVFNLTEANTKISTNAVNETFSYFETIVDAQSNANPILNFTAYTNQIVSNDIVFVRVTNSNGCFKIAQLNLNVSTTQIPLNYTRSFTKCDDAILGTNTDGIASFDFSSVTGQIQSIFPVGQLLTITYYRNLADALAESNAITDTFNYRNIGYPNTQNIYIRVDSQLNNDCLGLGSHITLNVERIPIVTFQELIHCDDDQDGIYGFNTATTQSDLLNGLTNVSVAYFDQNNNPLPSPLPNPFLTASQIIRAVVTNNSPTACSYETTIKFVVDDLPQAFPIDPALTTVCDDEAEPSLQNGAYAFDTATFHATILGGQTGMIVNYFDGNNNPLSSPLPNPFITATQTVRVEVINPINTTCKASAMIPFVVKPVPNINLSGNELVCNEQTLVKVINAGIQDGTPETDYTYVWKRNNVVIGGQTAYNLTVNQDGVYTVEVFNSQGCSRTRTITVVASDKATITSVNVIDLATPNSITVYVSGLGHYVYALDDENGVYQDGNVFSNVSEGIHIVYIKDLNGCGTVPKEVAVLGIPDYFTPNGDGYNDYWNIKGANHALNSKTIIYIFDRFGKLIKQISPTSEGWNGTFNNQSLPATDYWYTVQLEDGRTVKGHFALKR